MTKGDPHCPDCGRVAYPAEHVFAWLPVQISEPPYFETTGRWAWLRQVVRVYLPYGETAYVIPKAEAA